MSLLPEVLITIALWCGNPSPFGPPYPGPREVAICRAKMLTCVDPHPGVTSQAERERLLKCVKENPAP